MMPGTRVFFIVCGAAALVLLIALGGGALNASGVPMSDAAVAGYAVWRDTGCENCHTLYGQGGPYGPDLTHIYSQRGDTYIREFLIDPSAVHPSARQMPRFSLTKNDVNNLLAFLDWIGQSGMAAGWPPRLIAISGGVPSASVSQSGVSDNATSDDPVARGRALFSAAPAACSTCHSLEPGVRIVGPSLAGIADRAGSRVPGMSAEEYIRTSIVNPGAYVVEGFENVMAQNFAQVLSSENISDLIAFLMTQHEEGQ